jgi:hypothetical protein
VSWIAWKAVVDEREHYERFVVDIVGMSVAVSVVVKFGIGKHFALSELELLPVAVAVEIAVAELDTVVANSVNLVL